ncbi:hypothetical protein [Megasphaera sp. UBA4352]|uniref:hypothetical protein n=1 Tax=Megasphaera sp. UBA4352 TaxID=1946849 RepID=UPI00378311C4
MTWKTPAITSNQQNQSGKKEADSCKDYFTAQVIPDSDIAVPSLNQGISQGPADRTQQCQPGTPCMAAE